MRDAPSPSAQSSPANDLIQRPLSRWDQGNHRLRSPVPLRGTSRSTRATLKTDMSATPDWQRMPFVPVTNDWRLMASPRELADGFR
jgi:hypothetical protein